MLCQKIPIDVSKFGHTSHRSFALTLNSVITSVYLNITQNSYDLFPYKGHDYQNVKAALYHPTEMHDDLSTLAAIYGREREEKKKTFNLKMYFIEVVENIFCINALDDHTDK